MTIATFSANTSTGNAYVSSGNTAITWLSLCNYSANSIVANVYVVPNSSAAGTTNIVLAGLILTSGNASHGGGDTYQLYGAGEKLLLGPGDSIQVNCNAASGLTVVTSYTSI
jgi:hypothetical protein